MKLQCLNCDHEFDGTISRDELGWHSVCPECERSFDVDVPEGRIIMAFTDPDDEDEEDPYKYFDEIFHGQNIHLYMAFDTPREFIKKWKQIYDKPNGMWYWCLDNGYCFCSGACDPDDIEIFEDYFEEELEIEKSRKEIIKGLKKLHKHCKNMDADLCPEKCPYSDICKTLGFLNDNPFSEFIPENWNLEELTE